MTPSHRAFLDQVAAEHRDRLTATDVAFLGIGDRQDTPCPVFPSPLNGAPPGQDGAEPSRTDEDGEGPQDGDELATPPLPLEPVVIPAQRAAAAAAGLRAAADQLRDYAATEPAAWPLQLRRRYDQVDRGALYAVAEWLQRRADLLGATS